MRLGNRRDGFLSYYGPLSLIMLLVVWANTLALGFAMLHWGLSSALLDSHGQAVDFGGALYMSGSTLFTLGMGDITPRSTLARILTVAEAGTGIAFLALVIGYLPTIYQAFSRREINISLLDARAGSPPSASELLRRHAQNDTADCATRQVRAICQRSGRTSARRTAALAAGSRRVGQLAEQRLGTHLHRADSIKQREYIAAEIPVGLSS